MKYKQYAKKDAIKNYFPLPNEIFCLGPSAGEIAVYAYLMYCEDRKNFQCHPSYRTISRAVGLSRNTVKKYSYSVHRKKPHDKRHGICLNSTDGNRQERSCKG